MFKNKLCDGVPNLLYISVFHCILPSVTHCFRDNNIILLSGSDVIVIHPLDGALQHFIWHAWFQRNELPTYLRCFHIKYNISMALLGLSVDKFIVRLDWKLIWKSWKYVLSKCQSLQSATCDIFYICIRFSQHIIHIRGFNITENRASIGPILYTSQVYIFAITGRHIFKVDKLWNSITWSTMNQ